VKKLEEQEWDCHNLIVQIEDVSKFDPDFHAKVDQFSKNIGILAPKHVAYTIFPHKLHKWKKTAEGLFQAYNKKGGLYDWTRKRPRSGWGTYFRRMTHYEQQDGEVVNQLHRVIIALRDWDKLHRAAYTIVIPKPGADTARPRGGPCLNYIAPQVNPSDVGPYVSLLCVYRSHDFLERAYGNYWALCNLTQFVAKEAGFNPGSLTCISSRAYIPNHKTALKALLRDIS
jgi:thymidylate synthase